MTHISCDLVMKLEFQLWDCPDDGPCFLTISKQHCKNFTNANKVILEKLQEVLENFLTRS